MKHHLPGKAFGHYLLDIVFPHGRLLLAGHIHPVFVVVDERRK